MDTHVKVVAVLHIVFGIVGVLLAVLILIVFTSAAGAVTMAAQEDPDALIALPFIGLTGTALAVFVLLLSVPAVIAGIGLLKFRPWARILTIVLAALNLINIPIGTLLGIYTLWVMFSKDTEKLFGETPRAA